MIVPVLELVALDITKPLSAQLADAMAKIHSRGLITYAIVFSNRIMELISVQSDARFDALEPDQQMLVQHLVLAFDTKNKPEGAVASLFGMAVFGEDRDADLRRRSGFSKLAHEMLRHPEYSCVIYSRNLKDSAA